MPATAGTDWSGYSLFDTTDASQNCSSISARGTKRPETGTDRAGSGQLYHFLNVFHDHLLAAPIGFTEAAGNFQVTNTTGRGSGDPVEAIHRRGQHRERVPRRRPRQQRELLDAVRTASPGIMQMYLQRAALWPDIPSGDSGNEAETVYHEFTHGLSNRLVTTPDGPRR